MPRVSENRRVSPIPVSVMTLVGLGGALVGAGVLLSTQFGPLVSFGEAVLTVLAMCF